MRTIKRDDRKRYPMGTRGSVTIEANTDEPQTRVRGEQFALIIGDTLAEAGRSLKPAYARPGSPT